MNRMIKNNSLLMFFLLSILFLGCSTNAVIAPAGTYTADDGSWIIITKSNTWYGKIYETSIASSIDWEYFYAGEISANNELVITHGETRRVLPGGQIVDCGSVFGEFVNNEIQSGGVVFVKSADYYNEACIHPNNSDGFYDGFFVYKKDGMIPIGRIYVERSGWCAMVKNIGNDGSSYISHFIGEIIGDLLVIRELDGKKELDGVSFTEHDYPFAKLHENNIRGCSAFSGGDGVFFKRKQN